MLTYFLSKIKIKLKHLQQILLCTLRVFVCVEVLWPSQPIVVMSSKVSSPNHIFAGQAKFSQLLTSIVHILSLETDNCPSWISGRERMKIFHDVSPRKNVADQAGVKPANSWSPVRCTFNWVTEDGFKSLTLSLPQGIIIGFCKQHRSRWDGSMSRLIWIYTVWHSVYQLYI